MGICCGSNQESSFYWPVILLKCIASGNRSLCREQGPIEASVSPATYHWPLSFKENASIKNRCWKSSFGTLCIVTTPSNQQCFHCTQALSTGRDVIRSHSEWAEKPKWLCTDGGAAIGPTSGHWASEADDRMGETCAISLLQYIVKVPDYITCPGKITSPSRWLQRGQPHSVLSFFLFM